MEALNLYEAGFLYWIQTHLRTEFLDWIMTYISMLNNGGLLAIMAVCVLLLSKRYRPVGAAALISLTLEAVLVNVLLKNIVARERPYFVNEALTVLGTIPGDYSFPSGHTGSAFAVSTVMFLCMPKRYAIPAVVLSVLIALSRMYNAVHYPTDVLGGMLIGIAVGVLTSGFMAHIKQRTDKNSE